MFLAFKELKYSKTKFALIITVIFLISYLVYFLTSLASGLASSYTNAVEKWNSDQVILTVDANDNMMMSYMDQEDFDSVETTGSKAKLGLFPAVINNPSAENILDSRMNVYFLGIDNDSFIKPSELQDLTLTGNQVIVDEELKKVNSDYEAKRFKDITLNKPIVHKMPKNTFYKWMEKNKKLGGQHKVPRLANHRKFVEEILSFQNNLS